LVANWVRAYSVVMVGHLTHMKYGTGDDHVWYGWIFFGIVMLAIFWMGIKFGDENSPSASSVPAGASKNPSSAQQVLTSRSMGVAALVAMAVGTIGIVLWSQLPNYLRNFEPKNDIAVKALSQSHVTPGAPFPFSIGFDGAINSLTGTTQNQSRVQVSYFAKQDVNKELFAYGNRLVPDELKSARILSETRRSAPGLLTVGSVREYTMSVGGQPWVVWHWFLVDEYGLPDAYFAKGFRALAMLRGRGDHSVLLAIAQPGNADTPQLQEKLLGDALALHQATKIALSGSVK
jgi:Protein of unknown function (DUF3485)